MVAMTHKKMPTSTDAALFDADGASTGNPIAEGRTPKQVVASAKRAGGFAWIGLVNPSSDEVEELGAALSLPPLAVRDAAARGQQPKLQFFEGRMFAVLWALNSSTPRPRYEITETFVFAMDNVLVTIQYGVPEAGHLRAALDTDAPGAVGVIGGAYKVMAAAAARYTEAAHWIEQQLEELEDEVFDVDKENDAPRIYGLRRHIGKVHRSVAGITRALERAVDDLDAATGKNDSVKPLLRDLLDDLVGTSQLTDDQHKALDGIVASHENDISSRQGRESRRISAVAAIVATPAVIAGIYGMNFKNLPGVSSGYGWAMVVGTMAVIAAFMAFMFRRARWL